MLDKELPEIRLQDYKYDLPEERIAKFPLKERKDSKLLVYQTGNIEHTHFHQLEKHIPENTSLFFNDTRVIPARLHFKKETGAHIEVFLLEPVSPTRDVAQSMWVKDNCQWKCLVGNLKKWKDDQALTLILPVGNEEVTLKAFVADRSLQLVTFEWSGDHTFVDIIQAAGKIPLPPYINREVSDEDKERYQTIYSHHAGAVAAPTAGLHFSDQILKNLKAKGVSLNYLTLHVSAGTFQPVKEENVLHHPMHSEQIVVTMDNIDALLSNDQVIAVGTTSMRTLESLYWYGVKILLKKDAKFIIEKLLPYEFDCARLPEPQEAFKVIKRWMQQNNLHTIIGNTEIFIFPGYEFKVCKGLITNYHLPGSTLILLVAAFIGEDWRKVYKEALDNEYRFLSYGDSSLLMP
ncbi:S-adenosylmethionine:tRNA ribosyltransferase-isomerase [Fulvivirga imtechensis AK7]|uniref:S-adenosylmethionine:tRNA ribosyltransferase-isomerase n=1 Tax=Fulvivirga imtechensis AK7 TaxID=1237149 RepID=L8JXP8_9BACT|nr:S-adenosylmethionine:tRNA ribosyltransferase-isomerase [Fulvivirga imtechensis]ELR72404.1 S-adenosylmethionine:tRNA ribosyltransferase-isomerase [Fulvivirga imtechensis AK7]